MGPIGERRVTAVGADELARTEIREIEAVAAPGLGAIGWETDPMIHVVQASGWQDLPPTRDFLVSPGFAGLAAVVAAIIGLCAVMYAVRRARKRSTAEWDQRERHHEERREDEEHAVAVARCWDRWWQVLETAAIEPAASEGATLGLGPEVALELLRGLLRDAEDLGDETLARAVAVYQEQFLLVLAQQGGPLDRLARTPSMPANGSRNGAPSAGKHADTDAASVITPASTADVIPAAAKEGASAGRRRR